MTFLRQRLLAPFLLCCIVATPGLATHDASDPAADASWPGFRGAHQDGGAPGPALGDTGKPAFDLAWKRELGSGYSGVSVVGSRAVTFFSDGERDLAVALDTATGDELWRYAIGETYTGHDGSHTGPISTPIVAHGRVFGLAPRGELFALDLESGERLWTTHLVDDHGGRKPHYGYATSPLVAGDVLVVEVGADGGKAIVGFDVASGELRWSAGDDTVSYQSPILFELDGEPQVVAVGDKKLFGLAAASGEVRWQHEHGGDEGGNQVSSFVPVPAGDGRLLLTHKRDSSTLVRVSRGESGIEVEEVWISRGLKGSYSPPVYHQGHFYGFTGLFLTCVDAATGEVVWRSRPPGDGFLLRLGESLVVLAKQGSIHLVEASPEGYRELASYALFDDFTWTPPSFAGGRIYARSLSGVASLGLSAARPAATTVETTATAAVEGSGAPPSDSHLGRFLARLEKAERKEPVIDAFLASIESFPLVDRRRVHFLYRGEVEDLGLAGDPFGARCEEPMLRVPGTDLYHYTLELEGDARIAYRFVKDLEERIADPRNPRTFDTGQGEVSVLEMPLARPAGFLEPVAEERRGRLESHQLASEHFEGERTVEVYLPEGYDTSEARYPVVYVHTGQEVIERGDYPLAVTNLIGERIEPLIAVFIHEHPTVRGEILGDARDDYAAAVAEEIVPFVDARYRTRAEPAGRASVGSGFGAYGALYAALRRPGVFGKVGARSVFMLTSQEAALAELLEALEKPAFEVFLEWGRYDLRAPHEGWSLVDANRQLAERLERLGYPLEGGQVNDGFGWASWRHRTGAMLEALFPAAAEP